MGPKFTWSKHFENGNSIWERLDRGLATNNWFLKFLGSKVHHLRCDSPNNCPLYVTFSDLVLLTHKRVFRFKEMWLSHIGCEEIVHLTWNVQVVLRRIRTFYLRWISAKRIRFCGIKMFLAM